MRPRRQAGTGSSYGTTYSPSPLDRAGDGPFELVVAGETPGEDRKEGVRIVSAFEEAGVTWWIESIDPWRFGWTEGEPWPSEEMRRRVRQGPPEA
ncbi:MAG TPA: hypothetical protein VNT12_07805 [Rubrobacter sp.]|nr:hypothetical protein [Rubrobacter sp.]